MRVSSGKLQDGVVAGMVECRLILPSGEPLDAGHAIGRGPHLHVFIGTEWYGVDVRSLA
jgi:hypothetical protein